MVADLKPRITFAKGPHEFGTAADYLTERIEDLLDLLWEMPEEWAIAAYRHLARRSLVVGQLKQQQCPEAGDDLTRQSEQVLDWPERERGRQERREWRLKVLDAATPRCDIKIRAPRKADGTQELFLEISGVIRQEIEALQRRTKNPDGSLRWKTFDACAVYVLGFGTLLMEEARRNGKS